jgi:2-C-methyl-D-erythritol 4-phosphate cytidylyltransferase/2-C-methyl-D-erythritol 2,4-cyclodiphosphate synthase
MTSRIGAVIVAAGRGTRLGGDVPKQLLALGGKSLLRRSVAAFDSHPAIAELAVVLPAELVGRGRELAGPVRRPLTVVAGGARRQDSVRLGVHGLSPEVDLILIHDAARPFVEAALIDRVIAGAAEAGAALPAVPCRDTVKRVDPARAVVTATLPRDEIWLAQTPQGFRRDVWARVLAEGDRIDATDEAMLAERAGDEVRVAGAPPAGHGGGGAHTFVR